MSSLAKQHTSLKLEKISFSYFLAILSIEMETSAEVRMPKVPRDASLFERCVWNLVEHYLILEGSPARADEAASYDILLF